METTCSIQVECLIGHYADEAGSLTCKPCLADSFGSQRGATDSASCHDCPPRTHQPLNGSIGCMPEAPTAQGEDAVSGEVKEGSPTFLDSYISSQPALSIRMRVDALRSPFCTPRTVAGCGCGYAVCGQV